MDEADDTAVGDIGLAEGDRSNDQEDREVKE